MRGYTLVLFLLVIQIMPLKVNGAEERINIQVSQKKSIVGGLVKIDYLLRKPSGVTRWIYPDGLRQDYVLAEKITDTIVENNQFIKLSLFLTYTKPGDLIIHSFPVITVVNERFDTLMTPVASIEFIADQPIASIGPLGEVETLSNYSIAVLVAKILLLIFLVLLPFYYWKRRFVMIRPEHYDQNWALRNLRHLLSGEDKAELPTLAFQVLKKHLAYLGYPVNADDSERRLLENNSVSLDEELTALFTRILANSQTARFSPNPAFTADHIADISDFIRKLVHCSINAKIDE
jgi:hypothetical protein